jgi:ubiquinone/menaquinone biosynthesis C-methylase UbiE
MGFFEIHRVLKPGGRFLAVDLELPPYHHLLAGLATLFFGGSVAQSSLRTLVPTVEAVGFTKVEAGRTPFRVLSFLKGRLG